MENKINKCSIEVLKNRAVEYLFDYLNANSQNLWANHTSGPEAAFRIIELYYKNIEIINKSVNSVSSVAEK